MGGSEVTYCEVGFSHIVMTCAFLSMMWGGETQFPEQEPANTDQPPRVEGVIQVSED
jgi:hypothetical protein